MAHIHNPIVVLSIIILCQTFVDCCNKV